MKKLFSIFILGVFLLFLFSSITPAFAQEAQELDKSFLKKGISVSNIDLSTFLVQSGEIPVNSYFVEDPNTLVDLENVAYAHSIRTFVKLDFFLFPFESSKPANLSDLVDFYKTDTNLTVLEQQKLLSILSCLYEINGSPVTEVKQSEPEIITTYKYESTKTGYVAIPVRIPKVKDTLTTYFFLDPLKFPYKDSTSYYNFLKGTVIDKANILTKTARRKYQNPYIDFDGFYIPLPNKVTDDYGKIIKNSLNTLRRDIGEKLIIFTNVTKDNVNAIKDYGDIFVINFNDNKFDEVELLKNILNNKTIIANFNGQPNETDIRKFLDLCKLYGLVPKFGRDLSTNEYFYYENDFYKFTPIILDALSFIERVANLNYEGTEIFDSYSVSKFKNNSVLSHVFDGSGFVKWKIGDISTKNLNAFGDVDNVQFIEEYGNNYITFDLKGVAIVEVYKDDFYVESTTFRPSSSGSLSVFFRNGTNQYIRKILVSKVSGAERTFDFDLEPFGTKEINLDKNEIILVDGLTFMSVSESNNLLSEILMVLAILLFAFLLYKKSFPIKKAVNKTLLLILSLILTIALTLINLRFLGYSIVSLTYLIMSVIFLVYAFYKGRSRILSFTLIFIALFCIYSLSEFGTLLPHNQVVFPPYPTFEVILFYFAPIFALVLLLTFERKISKFEIATVFMLLAFLLVFRSLPFLAVERSDLFVYLPFLLIAVLIYFSATIDKKLKKSISFNILILLTLLTIFTLPFVNKFVIDQLLRSNIKLYPFSYAFLLLLPLIFLSLTEKEGSNITSSLDFNLVLVGLTLIYGISAILEVIGNITLSNPVYFYLGFIVQFLPFILLLILLTETIAR